MAGQRDMSRRFALALVACAAGLPAAPGVAQQRGQILVVSRGRIFEEAQAAMVLAEAEREQTAQLQAEIDEVRSALTAEEEELARLRDTLPSEEFDQRAASYDQRVRRERRRAQARAEALQQAFQDARRGLVEALDPLLEEIRLQLGAVAILDADQVLVHDPGADITEEVLERFNAAVAEPDIPAYEDSSLPVEDLPPVPLPGGRDP